MNPQLNPEQKRIWTEKGLERLRYEYDLNEDSVVYDIGACEGTFFKEIFRRYGCYIQAYEPIHEHYNNLAIYNNAKIKIFNNAVGKEYKKAKVRWLDENLCPIKSNLKAIRETIEYLSINDIVSNQIDLMKINIEGGEYELLEAITEDNLKLISNLQVQFHVLNDDSGYMRNKIHKKLKKTHKLTYEYPFCWENWRLK